MAPSPCMPQLSKSRHDPIKRDLTWEVLIAGLVGGFPPRSAEFHPTAWDRGQGWPGRHGVARAARGRPGAARGAAKGGTGRFGQCLTAPVTSQRDPRARRVSVPNLAATQATIASQSPIRPASVVTTTAAAMANTAIATSPASAR
jgi:hypothetical protein